MTTDEDAVTIETGEPEPAAEVRTDTQEPAGPSPEERAPAPEPEEDEPEPRSREAKRYREQRNEARAARDAAIARAEAMEARELDRLAADAGALPGALEDVRGRLDLSTLRDESGVLSQDLVLGAIEGLKAERAHWFAGRDDLDSGPRGSTVRPPEVRRSPTIGDLLREHVAQRTVRS